MLNQDYAERVSINIDQLDWDDSPARGVTRKKLERQAAESGRATSIVRYAPGSSFPRHEHTGGEEILVLDGVFSDESGDYPAGSYFRNPIGTGHSPYSQSGCTLFVKLHYFDPKDSQQIAINTRQQQWQPGLVEGVEVMPLHSFEGEHTALVKWDAGTRFNPHKHWGGEEILVLQGEFIDEYGRYPALSWLRSPHQSQHTPRVEQDTVIWVKTGHIPLLQTAS